MFNALIESMVKQKGNLAGENGEEKQVGDPRKMKKRCYKKSEDPDKINELSHKNFAAESKRKIRWAVNLYDDWRNTRIGDGCDLQIKKANLNALFSFGKQELAYSLIRFVTEIKRIDGKDYPPQTLRQIVIMIQMYLNENGIYWKLIDDLKFVQLRNVLDNIMKERTSAGLGVRQSSSIISMIGKF